jgi:hypothetical protein
MNKIKLTALVLTCCLPLVASNAFADDKMAPKMGGKMDKMAPKMGDHKMAPKMGGKMEHKMGGKMMGHKMMPKMSSSEKKVYMGMSRSEKALFDKYMGKM